MPNLTVFISLFKEVIGAGIILFLISFYFNYQLKGIWFAILITNYLSVVMFLLIVNYKMKSLGLKIFKIQ